MLEVLDNLPHDRFVRSEKEDSWALTWVGASDDDVQSMEWEEMLSLGDHQTHTSSGGSTDELARQCLRLFLEFHAVTRHQRPRRKRLEDIVFLPTSCLEFVMTLHDARPNHTLIAADFDELPEVTIPGYMAPLVASKTDGQTEDHSSYFVPRGSADIFFPTDFEFLQYMYSSVKGGIEGTGYDAGQVAETTASLHGTVHKTGDFMRR